ncbi:hypothetical protein CAOG_02332 [Capsaspora owczarzaki ATCC 30864]|uniref:Uncharacterized protein n=1 Tax=Capsaspora owczarzaki (strain ATCC 30864) TaxID=595528 RepID=A0A0D2X1P2_CAPO3|nr:hypothetical protein CAOG_02332 [Capsaspora owczarzaki ATCC 30864]KJE91154.1 hypothetical protein CAOG_002332 [Capsaspora owczarzaki ATCC 30864]|eukprot:XP_004349082.1 hypothetical protein CAOG_02332 [Capsaspora owczarzaki ATCC 30864]
MSLSPTGSQAIITNEKAARRSSSSLLKGATTDSIVNDAYVRIHRPLSRPAIDMNDIVIVSLTSVKLNRLYSTSVVRVPGRRSGVIVTSINGQEQTIGWRKFIKQDSEVFRHPQILYFGRLGKNNPLPTKVIVMETDSEIAQKALEASKTMFQGLGAVGSIVPGVGSQISRGFDVATALAENLAGLVLDDLELRFDGALGEFDSSGILVHEGDHHVSRFSTMVQSPKAVTPKLQKSMSSEDLASKDLFSPDADFDIQVTLKLERLPRSSRPPFTVAIVLSAIQLNLPGLRKPLANKQNQILSFDVTFGAGKLSSTYDFEAPLLNGKARAGDVFGIDNKVLYLGPWGEGLPFNASATVLKRKHLLYMDGLLQKASAFGTGFVAPEHAEDVGTYVSKGVQGVRSVVGQYLRGAKPIDLQSGVMLLDHESDDKFTLRSNTSVASRSVDFDTPFSMVLSNANAHTQVDQKAGNNLLEVIVHLEVRRLLN